MHQGIRHVGLTHRFAASQAGASDLAALSGIVAAAALGFLVLGEALAPGQWLGLAAVLAGVLIAGTEPRAAAPPPLG